MKTVAVGRHFMANDIRLHYLEYANDKPPLLIIPGITIAAACMAFVAARFSSDYHVYVLDLRGQGLSDRGETLGYLLDDHASDAIALIAHLGLKKPPVLAHCMGARIVIRAASRRPDSFGDLILVDPPVTAVGLRPYPIPLSQYMAEIDIVSKGQGRGEMKLSSGWKEEQVDLRMEWLPTCDKRAVSEGYLSFHEEDLREDMPKIASDALLIYAGRGDVVTELDAEEFCRLMPRCRRHLIAHTGHMIPWEDTELFYSVADEFLRRRRVVAAIDSWGYWATVLGP